MDERERTFRRLFDACYPPLVGYVRRRAAPSDVDDVVSTVFTVAWRRLDDIPPDAALPWLYGVARRTLANHRRGLDRRTRLTRRIALDGAPAATVGAGDSDVVTALARLRPADREILRLAAWEDLTSAEIATALACSPNAASLRLSRARRRFRVALTEKRRFRTQEERKVNDA